MEQRFLEEESSSSFDVKRYFSKLGKNFLWIIGAIVIFVAAAFFYLRYTDPLYQVSTNVLIDQPADAASILGGSAFSGSGGGSSLKNVPDIQNEIFKLRSAPLIGQVVDSLKLNIKVKSNDGAGKKTPIAMDDLPFTIQVKRAIPEKESPSYQLIVSDASFALNTDKSNLKGTYNSPIVVDGDTLVLTKKENHAIRPNSEYELQLSTRINTINQYIGRLAVAPLPKAGMGMLQLTLVDEFPTRARKFFSILINAYDKANLEYNNQALRTEMDFLNNRLAVVSAELDSQAKLVRDFKAGHQIYDISSAANQLLSNLPMIDSKKTDYLLKEDLLSLVESNIRSYNGKEDIVPNSSGLQDPVLGDQINRYNQLVLQKRTVLDNGTPQDPRLASIDGQMEQLRKNILKNVQNIRREIKTNYSSLAAQERNITGRFNSIPSKEKELIELNRVLGIKQSLYTFLLQKREDKNIELASSEIAESRILDDGFNKTTQIPKPMMVYGIAAAAGLLLPSIIILIRVLLNNKIETRKDVESATTLPIAGEIANVGQRHKELIITPGNTSPEAEQFRTLRTNIAYLSRGLAHKVLLVTSSKSEEGKSFISLNLANSMAISNKKVALLEFDLRNPGISEKLGISNTIGLANYLNEEVELEEALQQMESSENLYFMSSGYPLPLNPGELILSDRMNDLFDYLKKNFDAIIVDTPPVGPVSDALTLGKWADISFFIVRHKHTLRSTMKLINKLNLEEKLPRMTLIINGIQDTKEFSYGNDFGYGYGYAEEKKRSKKSLTNG